MWLESDDLLDANEVADLIGLSSRRAVSIYRQRYKDFPVPVIEKSSKMCVLWLRSDIEEWVEGRSS